MRRSLILFARAPSAPGKTRLTSHLAPDEAVALRRWLLLATFAAIRSVDAAVRVAFAPPDAREEIAGLFAGAPVALVPQRGNDLGERMLAAITDGLVAGADTVVLVGSDLPNLPAAHVQSAFAALEAGRDLVIGPTEDGGFYLIGMRRPQPPVFEGIAWGTARVLAQTLAAAARAGLDVVTIAPWYDVDCSDDLDRVASESRRECGS